jgi:hypothetical protein
MLAKLCCLDRCASHGKHSSSQLVLPSIRSPFDSLSHVFSEFLHTLRAHCSSSHQPNYAAVQLSIRVILVSAATNSGLQTIAGFSSIGHKGIKIIAIYTC